jgi:pyruvate formate lyase activating enzyme
MLHEARFYERLAGGEVLCTLCPHDCHIAEGGRGACGVRYVEGGKLYTLVYDRLIARALEPVEKKPLYHFHPGSRAYSIATVGCNLRCSFCQNWDTSQWPKAHLPKSLRVAAPDGMVCPQLADLENAVAGEQATPAEIVAAARKSGALSIAYTFTEPVIFYELCYDTATLARAQGLKNLFHTNGFVAEAPLRQIAPLLDAANVDLKFFRPESYRRISRARIEPVLDSIRLIHELGIWLEVTTLVIPGVNDSDDELRGIAAFIAALGPGIPWHVSQFYPAYRMLDRPVTPEATLLRAAGIGRAAGLRYVYIGNVPGSSGEDTRCPGCGALLIARYGHHVRANRIVDGKCPDCGAAIDGVGMSPVARARQLH